MPPSDNPADEEPVADDEGYLFVVDYDDDAERKRVEYLFNNWDDGSIKKPSGLVRVASDIDHDSLYEDLIAKVPPEQVQTYRLEPVDSDVEPETITIEEAVNAPADAVESFIEYMFSKKKAVLQSPARNEYEVYSKKGRAEVSYRLTENDSTTEVTIQVSGYSPAPEFLGDFFETELTDYANSQA
jgi:hypothetical protein